MYKMFTLVLYLVTQDIFFSMDWEKNYTAKIIQNSLFKDYFMKPACSAIKEKMFCVLPVNSLFTAK